MSNISTGKYVIGVVHDNDTWFYVGADKEVLQEERFSSALVDAVRYDNADALRVELSILPIAGTYKIIEVLRCPKCGKEFVGYPAISREDNKTEICPECGVKEAMKKYIEHTKKTHGSY